MCRNIKRLYNFDPPVTEKEIHEASLQFVRKLSGFNEPSKANEAEFNKAVEKISHEIHHLMHSLITDAHPRNREDEAKKAHQRALERFGKSK